MSFNNLLTIFSKNFKFFVHDRSQQKRLIKEVKAEIKLRSSFFLLLICSGVIGTLGLIINNSAVVIGSMLIAPLFWPMIGFSLSVVSRDKQLFKQALVSFIFSVLSVFVISFVIGLLIPEFKPGLEINSRLNPTIFDLLIALSSSVVGVLALYYPRISETVSGVAVSLSLLPPLVIAGLGLAVNSPKMFFNSLLLFGANVAAIIFVGILMLFWLGIRPRKNYQVFWCGLLASLLGTLLLALKLI